MTCLAHEKRFRSSFHSIINELRNEKRTPISILRTMPAKCCTCDDENKEIVKPVIMKEENQSIKLKNLIERANREKQTNPKLILSLYRLENLIEENRGPASILPESVPVQKQEELSSSSDESTSSSDSEDITPMEISKPIVRYGKKQNQKIQKPPKPIKDGTFLFLPYVLKSNTQGKKSDSLIGVAKKLQLGRFISRNGHIAELEKQYGVRINMITPKTSKQVTEALENAKKGLEKLAIHNQPKSMAMSENQEGEWVLIQSKKQQNKAKTADIEQLVDELTNRWETCLNIRKRNGDEADNSDDLIRKKK